MRARRIAGLALALLAAPGAAQAHLMNTGLGPVFDGVAHFGVTPEDALPVAVLGLFAGLRGAPTSRLLFAALPFAWLSGGALALAGAAPPPLWASGGTALLFLAIGLLLATDARLSPPVSVATAVALGLLRGAADLAGAAPTLPNLGELAAMSASAAAGFALAASLTLPLTRAWPIVAARVGGSWLAASGLLLAGWLIRYGARAG